ncbi:MAG TPA: hypothetical protein VIC05_07890 [Solirubrobacteraceae bacterium]
MEQLSRPYQIALIALVGVVLVWFVALRHHGQSPPGTTATQTAAISKPATQASPATATPVYKGAAPGVEGLTRAIRKAHEAVATSQQNAHTMERKASEASGERSASASPAPSHRASPTTEAPTPSKASPKHHQSSSPPVSPAEQVTRELAQGKTVMLLFWNSKSVDDRAVRVQLRLAQHALGRKVAVHEASASQIGMFGQVTQDVRVNETPTILIISPKRLVTPLIGLTDAFSIRQAVSEAR